MTQDILAVESASPIWHFGDSGQSGQTHLMTLTALAAGAVRVGARVDRGAGALPDAYFFRFTYKHGVTAVVGETVEIHYSTSDGTRPDGEVGTADALGAIVMLDNCEFLKAAKVQVTTSDTFITCSGKIWIPTRYWSPLIYNRTTKAFKTSTTEHNLKVWSLTRQIQNAV